MSVVVQSWLDIQCRMMHDIIRAVVVLGEPGRETGNEVAAWPTDEYHELLAIADVYLGKNRMIGNPFPQMNVGDQPSLCIISFPLMSNGRLSGVFVTEIPRQSEGKTVSIGRMLESGWLWLQFARELKIANHSNDLLNLIRLMIACLEPRGLRHSAMAFVNQLAVHFGCASVGLGLLKGRQINVYALSNSARFESQSKPVLALAAAMNEAVDQERIVVFPPVEDGRCAPIMRAHADLAREQGVDTLLTVPLASGNRMIGALTLERQRTSFDATSVNLCRFVAMLAGPILTLKRENDRGPLASMTAYAHLQIVKLFGAEHVKYKTTSAVLALSLLFLTAVKSDYRVSTDAVLEGTVQRVVVSPMDGYIASARVRPGDIVKEGAIMGTLDDKDITLEHVKWTNQLQQHQREYREAMALHDSPKVSILSAQISQAEAQIALLNEKLARIAISAPFDSVVIDGDLSQSLGSPISRGDVLFKVAPLNDYRLMINVDEKNIAEVKAGQRGNLVLSSLPRDSFPFVVEKSTPVSVAKEGRNYFRVEAKLENADGKESLRPGMKGIGKIGIGQRRIIWIWTHALIDWLRLWAWVHLP